MVLSPSSRLTRASVYSDPILLVSCDPAEGGRQGRLGVVLGHAARTEKLVACLSLLAWCEPGSSRNARQYANHSATANPIMSSWVNVFTKNYELFISTSSLLHSFHYFYYFLRLVKWFTCLTSTHHSLIITNSVVTSSSLHFLFIISLLPESGQITHLSHVNSPFTHNHELCSNFINITFLYYLFSSCVWSNNSPSTHSQSRPHCNNLPVT